MRIRARWWFALTAVASLLLLSYVWTHRIITTVNDQQNRGSASNYLFTPSTRIHVIDKNSKSSFADAADSNATSASSHFVWRSCSSDGGSNTNTWPPPMAFVQESMEQPRKDGKEIMSPWPSMRIAGLADAAPAAAARVPDLRFVVFLSQYDSAARAVRLLFMVYRLPAPDHYAIGDDTMHWRLDTIDAQRLLLGLRCKDSITRRSRRPKLEDSAEPHYVASLLCPLPEFDEVYHCQDTFTEACLRPRKLHITLTHPRFVEDVSASTKTPTAVMIKPPSLALSLCPATLLPHVRISWCSQPMRGSVAPSLTHFVAWHAMLGVHRFFLLDREGHYSTPIRSYNQGMRLIDDNVASTFSPNSPRQPILLHVPFPRPHLSDSLPPIFEQVVAAAYCRWHASGSSSIGSAAPSPRTYSTDWIATPDMDEYIMLHPKDERSLLVDQFPSACVQGRVDQEALAQAATTDDGKAVERNTTSSTLDPSMFTQLWLEPSRAVLDDVRRVNDSDDSEASSRVTYCSSHLASRFEAGGGPSDSGEFYPEERTSLQTGMPMKQGPWVPPITLRWLLHYAIRIDTVWQVGDETGDFSGREHRLDPPPIRFPNSILLPSHEHAHDDPNDSPTSAAASSTAPVERGITRLSYFPKLFYRAEIPLHIWHHGVLLPGADDSHLLEGSRSLRIAHFVNLHSYRLGKLREPAADESHLGFTGRSVAESHLPHNHRAHPAAAHLQGGSKMLPQLRKDALLARTQEQLSKWIQIINKAPEESTPHLKQSWREAWWPLVHNSRTTEQEVFLTELNQRRILRAQVLLADSTERNSQKLTAFAPQFGACSCSADKECAPASNVFKCAAVAGELCMTGDRALYLSSSAHMSEGAAWQMGHPLTPTTDSIRSSSHVVSASWHQWITWPDVRLPPIQIGATVASLSHSNCDAPAAPFSESDACTTLLASRHLVAKASGTSRAYELDTVIIAIQPSTQSDASWLVQSLPHLLRLIENTHSRHITPTRLLVSSTGVAYEVFRYYLDYGQASQHTSRPEQFERILMWQEMKLAAHTSDNQQPLASSTLVVFANTTYAVHAPPLKLVPTLRQASTANILPRLPFDSIVRARATALTVFTRSTMRTLHRRLSLDISDDLRNYVVLMPVSWSKAGTSTPSWDMSEASRGHLISALRRMLPIENRVKLLQPLKNDFATLWRHLQRAWLVLVLGEMKTLYVNATANREPLSVHIDSARSHEAILPGLQGAILLSACKPGTHLIELRLGEADELAEEEMTRAAHSGQGGQRDATTAASATSLLPSALRRSPIQQVSQHLELRYSHVPVEPIPTKSNAPHEYRIDTVALEYALSRVQTPMSRN